MEVETKNGKIVASEAGTEYPGIWLEYIDNNDNGQNLSRPQVLMEADPETGRVRLLIWDDPDQEDYTREIYLTPAPRTRYLVDMVLRKDVLANFEIEALSDTEAEETVEKLFADTDVTDDDKVNIVVHREDYDEDNIVITFTNENWTTKNLNTIQNNVEDITFRLHKQEESLC